MTSQQRAACRVATFLVAPAAVQCLLWGVAALDSGAYVVRLLRRR